MDTVTMANMGAISVPRVRVCGFGGGFSRRSAAVRHAKKVLKKHVRGVRPLERAVEGRTDPEAEVLRGYCSAVRSVLTDDGRPPLAAAGLQLHDRLNAIAQSLERVEKRGPCPRPSGA